MAKQAMSSLAQRLGEKAKQAAAEGKEKPAEYGSGGLPAGIEGGVARLVDCKFMQIAAGKANAGKDMFFAAGIVVSPEEINGVHIKGLRTQISEPLYDTPTRGRKTVAEHVEHIQNEFKKMGVDAELLDLENFEQVAATLKEDKPYFRFRTWAGSKQDVEKKANGYWVGTKGPYTTEAQAKQANPFAGKDPTVQHDWQGKCEHYEEEDDAGAGVVDETAVEAEAAPEPVKPTAKPKADKPAAKPAPEPEPEMPDDVDELATLADSSEEGAAEAQLKLGEMATAAGLDENVIVSADNWAAVAEAIKEASGGTDEESAAESEVADEQQFEPEVGNVFPYKAPGKKKPVDCAVVAINAAKRTVNLKNLDDEKTMYKGVSWDELTSD